jgi:diguanylate cyclase (GGDEF)-like protein
VDASGRVLYTNHQLHAIVGRQRAATFADQLSTVLAEDGPRVTEAFDAALRGGLDSDIEVPLATSEATGAKEIRQCSLSIRTLVSDDGTVTGAVASLADVTDSVRMRDELRLQATFDKLTSCYNRASTMAALEDMVAGAPAGRRPAVVFVDLDEFKTVNDHLGHGAGDQMLEIVARRLHRAVRQGDVVGRIGGDEFLVLFPGIGSDAEAMGAADRVARSLRHDVKLRGAVVSCRASVGVAWSADTTVDGDTLISRADAAMYEAKRARLADPVLFGHGV